MLMHADTVTQSALKADSGRKIPCRTGDSNPRQYCACFYQLDALPTELFPSVKYLLLLSFPPVNFQCRLFALSLCRYSTRANKISKDRHWEITLRTTTTLIMKTTMIIIIIIMRRRNRRRNDNDGNTSDDDDDDDVGDTEISYWRRKRLSFGRKMKPFSIVATWRRQRQQKWGSNYFSGFILPRWCQCDI